ncbi:hypothetical protein [Brumimicrobium mesophilum]|uniref:hypothetical protein n=1 Tax=Brumimicrobium mesophilum TaxID=392717 RepID=UPI000D1432F1|nr:hypothetical protein [Brumimicrobium mesophilum]
MSLNTIESTNIESVLSRFLTSFVGAEKENFSKEIVALDKSHKTKGVKEPKELAERKKLKAFKRFSSKRCPDDKKPRLLVTFDGTKFSKVKSSPESKQNKKIFFILESPHKDEYDSTGNGIRPANGTSSGSAGGNFNKSILDVLDLFNLNKKCFSNGTYEIYILNAVSFQTSLGHTTDEYRTVLFRLLWDLGGKVLFESKIQSKLEDSNCESFYFINACTIGGPSKKRERIVDFQIKNEKDYCLDPLESTTPLSEVIQPTLDKFNAEPKVTLLNSYHPSRWKELIK